MCSGYWFDDKIIFFFQIDGRVYPEFNYRYDSNLDPDISHVQPSTLDVSGGTVVTINGTGFRPNGNLTVMIGSKHCTITSASMTSIVCIAPDQSPGQYSLTVYVPKFGATKPSINVTYNLVVRDFQPRCGSMVGGTDVIITGQGFGSNTSNIDVFIGYSRCETKEVNDTQIKCVTSSSAKVVEISNGGVNPGKS